MQEEDRLKHECIENVNLVSISLIKGQKRKIHEAAKGLNQKKPIKNKYLCFFYRKTRH